MFLFLRLSLTLRNIVVYGLFLNPERLDRRNPTNYTILNQSLCLGVSVKSLVGGRTYYFRVVAYSLKSFENSEEIKFPVPARVKHKAITAGVVGGLLFFIVAIILSVCAVKICNKRKRRKHEKGIERRHAYVRLIIFIIIIIFSFSTISAYNMVACRITDARNGGQIPGTSQVPLKK